MKRFFFIPNRLGLLLIMAALFALPVALFAQDTPPVEPGLLEKLAAQLLPLLIPVVVPALIGLVKSWLSKWMSTLSPKTVVWAAIGLGAVLSLVGDVAGAFSLSEIWWVKGILAVILGMLSVSLYEVVKKYLPSYDKTKRVTL